MVSLLGRVDDVRPECSCKIAPAGEHGLVELKSSCLHIRGQYLLCNDQVTSRNKLKMLDSITTDEAHSTSSLYVLCIRMSPLRFSIYRAAQAHAMVLLPYLARAVSLIWS